MCEGEVTYRLPTQILEQTAWLLEAFKVIAQAHKELNGDGAG
jgi:hypothetical protein